MIPKVLVKGLGWAFTLCVLAFLLIPVTIIIPTSFSDSSMLDFPPAGWTTRWYEGLVESRDWPRAALVSLKIGLATAVITTLLGLLIGLTHFLHGRLSPRTKIFLVLPMLIPHIILATGLFNILIETGGLGEMWALVLVNVAIALPLVVQLVLVAFDTIDPLLWTAGNILGGRPSYVLRVLILPLVSVSLLATLILAFHSAWDETTFAVFIGPLSAPPLASRLFSYLQQNVTPEVTAVVALLLVITAVGAALVSWMNMRQRRRLQQPGA